MLKELKSNEIQDWDFGDVIIKTYSYGQQSRIAELISNIRMSGKEITADVKDNLSIYDLNMLMLSAGIHIIRNKDGTELIGPLTKEVDKLNFLDKTISSIAGNDILREISLLNQALSREEKKNLDS